MFVLTLRPTVFLLGKGVPAASVLRGVAVQVTACCAWDLIRIGEAFSPIRGRNGASRLGRALRRWEAVRGLPAVPSGGSRRRHGRGRGPLRGFGCGRAAGTPPGNPVDVLAL